MFLRADHKHSRTGQMFSRAGYVHSRTGQVLSRADHKHSRNDQVFLPADRVHSTACHVLSKTDQVRLPTNQAPSRADQVSSRIGRTKNRAQAQPTTSSRKKNCYCHYKKISPWNKPTAVYVQKDSAQRASCRRRRIRTYCKGRIDKAGVETMFVTATYRFDIDPAIKSTGWHAQV